MNFIQHVHVYMSYDYDWKATPFGAKIWSPTLSVYKGADTENSIFLQTLEVAVEVPDNFNPVPAQVAALEAAKAAALAEYTKSVAEINDRLSKLLCIEAPDAGKEFA